jgi:hypothetical protein
VPQAARSKANARAKGSLARQHDNFLRTLSTQPSQTLVFSLQAISTPLQSCRCLRVGKLAPDAIIALQAGDFDQAPVLDDDGNVLGVIETVNAERLAEQGAPLSLDSDLIVRTRMSSNCTIDALLGALAEAQSVLVESENGELGLVTVSDLNRHRFRTYLYFAFAELEALLARLIDVTYDNPWEWLVDLREDIQARLVGYWEISKRRGVDIGPQAAATLTELLMAVATSDRIRSRLGYRSRKSFDKLAGSLPEYRNRVMHPIRPLVLDREEVAKVKEALTSVETLVREARAMLTELGQSSRVPWL